MAFQQALSGLNLAGKAIDVVSHNIANSSTVGFKAGSAHFSDVYAASLNGSGASQIGIGAALASVQQQFTQGNISTTNNPLDISINGGGFFRMDSNGAVTFSRNGQFHLDKNGYIVNDQEMKLTGFPAENGMIIPTTPQPLVVSAANLAPVATGSNTTSSFNGVKVNVNLDARVDEPQVAWGTPADTGGLWTPSPQSYNYSTALTVYDSLGNDHSLTFYFRKTANPGEWEVYTNMDGTSAGYINGGASHLLQFNPKGDLALDPTDITYPIEKPDPLALSINLDDISSALGLTNGALTPWEFEVEFNDTTQHGSPFGTNRLEQDGYAAGNLIGLAVGNDGVILGRYSNGQTFKQGQVVLANFTNPNGLSAQGDNQWTETSMSGPPLVGAPNTSSLGTLNASSVEDSNVDLTSELVNLITSQRNYQANAQSIKTQDQVLQTLVNLR